MTRTTIGSPPGLTASRAARAVSLSGVLMLAACGGGGGGEEPPAVPDTANPPMTETDPNGNVGQGGGADPQPNDPGTGAEPPGQTMTPPPEALVARWASQAEFGSTCVHSFSFNSDYTFSSESAEERRDGFYTVDAEPNEADRRRLEFTFTSDNGLPNCLGSVEDQTGQTFVQWVELNGLYMGWFDGPDASAANVRDWTFVDGAER